MALCCSSSELDPCTGSTNTYCIYIIYKQYNKYMHVYIYCMCTYTCTLYVYIYMHVYIHVYTCTLYVYIYCTTGSTNTYCIYKQYSKYSAQYEERELVTINFQFSAIFSAIEHAIHTYM